MSELHEDVIADLLPLYFSGDASAASCATVEAYFAVHPAFAAAMRTAMASAAAVPRMAPDAGNASATGAIKRIRRQLRWRAVLIAAGIFSTVTPFSFVVTQDKLVYLMWRDTPALAAAFACLAVVSWTALWIVVRRTDAR